MEAEITITRGADPVLVMSRMEVAEMLHLGTEGL